MNDVFDEILSHYSNGANINDSVNADGAVPYSILTSECKQPRVLFEKHKIGFRGNNKHTKRC